MDTIDWLLDSDPAIRWQAMRDLTDACPAAVAAERAVSHAKGSAPQSSPARDRTARGTGPAPPTGCQLSPRCSSCVRPASTAPNLRSRRRWRASRRASDGTRNLARSRSSRARWSRASTAARSRLAATSGDRRRPRAPACQRAARRRRLELRSADERALVVPHHDLRAGGTARVRACGRATPEIAAARAR